MKKSLLALAALTAFAGVASAQSSVTLYGVVDVNVSKQPGVKKKAVDEAAGSRIGFRGREDLGGGLAAIFKAEHRFTADNGDPKAADVFWRGGTDVGLEGGFGQIRLGRTLNDVYLTGGGVDPFTTDGVGSNATTITGGVVGAWINNVISYAIAAGGFSFTAQYAEAAGNAAPSSDNTTDANDNPWSMTAGYAAGPVSVRFGHYKSGVGDGKWSLLAGSYNLGVATLTGALGKGVASATGNDVKSYLLGAIVPLGSGQINVSYGVNKNDDTKVYAAKKFAVGYRHNMSKRTSLYATLANDRAKATERNGYEFGIKHTF